MTAQQYDVFLVVLIAFIIGLTLGYIIAYRAAMYRINLLLKTNQDLQKPKEDKTVIKKYDMKILVEGSKINVKLDPVTKELGIVSTELSDSLDQVQTDFLRHLTKINDDELLKGD